MDVASSAVLNLRHSDMKLSYDSFDDLAHYQVLRTLIPCQCPAALIDQTILNTTDSYKV